METAHHRPKVFVLSMHRVGTQSTDSLLRNLGFQSIHNPAGVSKMDFQCEWVGHEDDREFIFNNLMQHVGGTYDAISDNPMAALYAQAFTQYPGAKFILMLRDPDSWIASIREHIKDREFVPAEKVQYWKYLDGKPLKLSDISDEGLKKAYLRHEQEIIDYFIAHHAEAHLCVVRMEMGSEEIGKKISSFLGCEYQPFPKVDYVRERQLLGTLASGQVTSAIKTSH